MTVTAPRRHDMMQVMSNAAVPTPADAVRVASTSLADPRDAAQQLFRALDPTGLAGAILFCSSRYPLDALAEAIADCSEGLTVIGCTSSGN